MSSLIKVTVAGQHHYVRESSIDAFGPQMVQTGASEDEDGMQAPEFAERVILTLHSGMQIPIEESMDEFLLAAAKAERDGNPLLAVRGA